MATITVPDFMFSGFYYPEILEALLAYTRVNAQELTSESEYEPHIQLLRSYALVGHLNNTRVDVVANELLLDSALLRESVKRLFRLIGYKLASATPATAELLILLSTPPLNDITEYIPEDTQWGTEQEDGEEIIYENTETYALNRADQIENAFILSETQNGSDGSVDTTLPQRFTSAGATFTSADVGRLLIVVNSANGNAGEYVIGTFIDANNIDVIGATFVSETSLVWSVNEYGADKAADLNDEITTVSLDDAKALYVGHRNIQWNQIDVTVSAVSADKPITWAYYDNTYSRFYPESVTDIGGQVEFQVNQLLAPDELSGWTDRSGWPVKVTYSPSSRSETVVSLYSGARGNYIQTRGLFGQSVVDTEPLNYIIETDWIPVPNYADDTSDLSVDGDATYTLPMSTVRRWMKATVNDEENYWFKAVIGSSGSTYPVLNNFKITEGDLYFPFDVVQGITISNEVLGSSNGQADQEFLTLQGPVFDDSYTVEVDETGGGSWVAWVETVNLLNASSTDRYYTTRTDRDGRMYVEFGNGVNGKIPPIGTDNVRITYRVGGEENGNVGSGQITGNIDGIQYVASVLNPMSAVGWQIKEGGDEVDLERVKDAGPASIRNQSRAVSPSDVPRVAIDEYRTEDGSAIVARAFAIEEAYGPKTMELVVVGTGGEFLTAEQLDDLATFYNGDRYSTPPVEGVLLLNHEITPVNYDPKPVDCTYLVIGKGISSQQVVNALTAYLQPLATKEDGSYSHEFGGLIATVMLDCAVKDVSTSITNVHRTLPAEDINLGPRQLPNPGTITVSIQESE